MSKVICDDFGLVCCGNCGTESLCDPATGEMPEFCEECGVKLDYSLCHLRTYFCCNNPLQRHY